MSGPSERLKLRILVSTLGALRSQALHLSDAHRARVFGSSLGMLDAWLTLATQLHAATAEEPAETTRATTMEAA
jgi:hypothetical protein